MGAKVIIDGIEYEDVCIDFCESVNCMGCRYCECGDHTCITMRTPNDPKGGLAQWFIMCVN